LNFVTHISIITKPTLGVNLHRPPGRGNFVTRIYTELFVISIPSHGDRRKPFQERMAWGRTGSGDGAMIRIGDNGAHQDRPSDAVVDIALEIAGARAKILAQMKEAILAKDKDQAIAFAKQLCGIEDESKTH
jgi:hypothetical protein